MNKIIQSNLGAGYLAIPQSSKWTCGSCGCGQQYTMLTADDISWVYTQATSWLVQQFLQCS